ncbi:MAG TPA: ABC transporter permease, partial [Chloroflexota bacterium]
VVVVLSHLVLTRTKFGRFVYAVGGNPEAARLSGLNVGLVVTAVYVISGLFAGLAGLVLTSRLNAADPVTATGWELNAIAAVVIGGTSLFGGVGSVLGTLLGALIIGVINNGLTLMNVPSYYQQIAVGIIIVLAVWLDHLSKGRARRSRALARHRAGAASAVEKGGDERPSAV